MLTIKDEMIKYANSGKFEVGKKSQSHLKRPIQVPDVHTGSSKSLTTLSSVLHSLPKENLIKIECFHTPLTEIKICNKHFAQDIRVEIV